jgi:signal transduction histidine kinase
MDPKYIILGTMAMLLPVGAIIAFVFMYYAKQRRQVEALKQLEERHQQEMLEISLEAQETVRRQIGGDLHDDIGTLLSATRLSLTQLNKTAENALDSNPFLTRTQDLLNEAISNVRRLSKDLTPSTLDEFGLIIALTEFAKKINSHTGVNVNFELEGENERFEKKVELPLYRITQELVNNSLKHGKPTQIDIEFINRANSLLLSVSDNGIGFDTEEIKHQPNRGIGLRNIESRLSILKGRIIFDVAKGKGSQILIEIPRQAP